MPVIIFFLNIAFMSVYPYVFVWLSTPQSEGNSKITFLFSFGRLKVTQEAFSFYQSPTTAGSGLRVLPEVKC